MHVYKYVCICLSIFCMYVFVYVFFVCMYVFVYVFFVSMYQFVYVFLYVCMYVCICQQWGLRGRDHGLCGCPLPLLPTRLPG